MAIIATTRADTASWQQTVTWTLSALPLKADIANLPRNVRFVPILLQKSPRREARCALAPNTSLDFELR
jgi:hypothetical protein